MSNDGIACLAKRCKHNKLNYEENVGECVWDWTDAAIDENGKCRDYEEKI